MCILNKIALLIELSFPSIFFSCLSGEMIFPINEILLLFYKLKHGMALKYSLLKYCRIIQVYAFVQIVEPQKKANSKIFQ